MRCLASNPDAEGYAKAAVVAAAERPLLSASGAPVPWGYGRYERARLKHVYW